MRNAFILLAELIVFIILLGLYFLFMPYYFDSNYVSMILVVLLISIIIFSFRKKPITLNGNYFTITFIFILSFLIVHFQIYLDYALSLRDNLDVNYYLDYTLVPKAITLAAMAINIFIIGNILYLLKTKDYDNTQVLRKFGFSRVFLGSLVIIFFLLFIYITPLDYFRGGYGELSNNGGVGYLQYKVNHLFQVSVWAYIISNIITLSEAELKLSFIKYLKKMNPFILFIIALYFFLNILAGDRGPIINISILLFVGYLISQKKSLGLKKMIVVLLVSGSLLQFMSFFRETDASIGLYERIESAVLIKKDIGSRNESSILPSTVELAKSIRAYHAVVMDQEHNNILYGLGNLGYLVAIVPGLGLLIQSAIPINFSSSATYITDVLGADHGLGTTVLADIYLNYGFLGVLVVFLFFGYLFAKLDAKAYSNFVNTKLYMQILFLMFLSFALYLGRSTFAIVFSDFVLVYVLIRISSSLKKTNK